MRPCLRAVAEGARQRIYRLERSLHSVGDSSDCKRRSEEPNLARLSAFGGMPRQQDRGHRNTGSRTEGSRASHGFRALYRSQHQLTSEACRSLKSYAVVHRYICVSTDQ